MSMISVILDPAADGTLHVPLPAHLRGGKVRVTATLEKLDSMDSRGTPLNALKQLRKLGTFRDIEDPEAWQREQRRERILPGRE